MSVTSFAVPTDDDDTKQIRCSPGLNTYSKPKTRSKGAEQESESSSNWVDNDATSRAKGRAWKVMADSGIRRVVRKLVF